MLWVCQLFPFAGSRPPITKFEERQFAITQCATAFPFAAGALQGSERTVRTL